MPTKEIIFIKETAVPSEFYSLFWDVDPEKIDLEKNARYVIERVLELGDLKALKWIQMLYPTGLIVEILKTSRKISPKSKNFWTIWFD
ncbi:MAG: hypothetical protein QY316_13055 [Thermodesulfobacteriota bacterium]|nr:MAG: hypothetical protein QY316_13055 [Thermodesulfobacteriota bacterium]